MRSVDIVYTFLPLQCDVEHKERFGNSNRYDSLELGRGPVFRGGNDGDGSDRGNRAFTPAVTHRDTSLLRWLLRCPQSLRNWRLQ